MSAPVSSLSFSKLQKLNDSNEKEIIYRDQIIENLQAEKKSHEKSINLLSTLRRKISLLEDDLLYRDKLIVKKDSLLYIKAEKIKNLQEQLTRLSKDSEYVKTAIATSTTASNTNDIKLLEKIKQQQTIIEALKKTLSDNEPAAPHINASLNTSTDLPAYFLDKHGISLIFSLILIAIFLLSLLKMELKECWYINTPFEPLFYAINDQDIDYNFYNIADIDINYVIKPNIS